MINNIINAPPVELPAALQPKDLNAQVPGQPITPQPVISNFWRGFVAPIATGLIKGIGTAYEKVLPKTSQAINEGAPDILNGGCFFLDKYIPIAAGVPTEEVEALRLIAQGVGRIVMAYMEDKKNVSSKTAGFSTISNTDFTNITGDKQNTANSSSSN
jgi:hypothetical protein